MVLNPTWTGIWTLAAAVAAVTAVESTLKTYTVLAPCSVRPFSEYQVVVTLEGTDQDTTVQLKLTAPGEDGVNRTVEEDVVVPPNQSRTALLQVPALGVGKVTLSARGQGGLDFYNSTEVQLEWRNASVLIQTDKAKYKPGQTVRLRVLTLDAGLKPTVRGPLHVHVTDARGNRIKQWLTTTPPSGLWSASLPLSEQTLLGEWTVEAKLPSRQGVPVGSAKKSFTVAEYVLPTFEVTANAPKVTSFSQPKIGVTITAKYTFGKPVEGRVTVRANLPYYYIFDHPFHHGLPPVPVLAGSVEPADGNATSTSTTTSTTTTTTTTTTSTTAPPPFVTPEKRPKFVEKVVPIDGITTVEFDVIQDLKMDQQQHYNSVDFQVSVEEGLTGRRQNATEIHTEVRALDYDVQFVDSPHDFTPGKPVTVKVKVTNLEDAPIQDNDNPVTLSIMGHFTEKEQTRVLKEEKIPASGIVSFQIDTNDNQTSYSLEAKYRNKTAFHYLSTFTPYSSSSELTLHVETNSIKVGDDVVVRVHTKSQVRQLTMLVIAPLGIKEARSEPVLDVNGTTLHFKATSDLAPASRLLVHALLKNGTIVTDVCAFKVDDPLPVVGVRVAPGRSQPGQDVRLEVSAQPNATVALLAVDQSVLLLQDSATNDIAADELRRERLSFEARERTPWGGTRSDSDSLADHQRWRGYYDSEEESFKDAGLVFLSNAKVFQREYPKFEAVAFAGAPVAFGAVAANSGGMRPPGAFGAPIPPVGLAGTGSVAPRLRTRFPETWLWESVDSGADGNVTLMRTVPDTITSWFVTALAVDPVKGVGLGAPAKLTVFRPFFVSLILPYAVIRGETVQVPVSVFNYLDDEVTATVTLDNQRGDFEFASNTTGGRARRAEAAGTARSVQVKVPAQGSASAAFSITPTKVGHALLRVTATSDKAGDAVERPLKVKAEGDTQYRNKAIMVDLRKDMKLKTKVELEMPNNIVPDSENVEVSAIADVLGPTTANLDSLIRIPYGCGEQNMLNFVPNIVVIKYLNRTRQAHPELVRKARSYTEMGYQRELTYRHKDGSFSAFGESDKNGSTWLTAFVAKSFRMATSLVDVEDRIVNEALQWLAKQQADNGSFPEVGTVSHRDMQGGSAKGLALTAYVLIAFMQGQDATFEHQATVKKSLEYLVSNMDSLDDPYAIAIAAYALHVANHPAKDKAFTLLESKAEDSGQHRWWNKTVEGDKDNPHWGQPNSVNVEMTSYALLTYLERGLIEKAVPVMQWLVSQRNSNGGFASTQDTVVGLQALAAMAERVSLAGGDMRIVFAHGASPADAKKEESIVVNSKTGSVLQKHELPRNTRLVEVSAEGTGFALAQVSWSYNEDTAEKHPLFNLRVHVDNATQPNLLSLRVCSSFVAGRWGTESNMAVIEVTLPSGFAADLDSLGALKADPNVRRVETKDQDGIIVLYFDKMETKDYCVDVSAVRAFSVSNQKPVPITVYDYYDQSRRARKFYEAPKVETADKAH